MSDQLLNTGDISGMFWRFLVAADSTVSRFLVRDADSRLNDREYFSVLEWMESGFSFHILRDHPAHDRPINGGMWGGTSGILQDISKAISLHSQNGYGADQDFLRSYVFEKIKLDHLAHDSYSCERWPNSVSFPSLRAGSEHVGQVFDAHEMTRPVDNAAIVNTASPHQCSDRNRWKSV
jgi:hypothetical protein